MRLGEVRRDPPEPPPVAERLGLQGRAPQMIERAGELAERGERGPQVEDEIDGRLEGGPARAVGLENLDRLLEETHRLPVRRARGRLGPRLAQEVRIFSARCGGV